MIPVTDANIKRLGRIAAYLDACLRERGLPPLSDAQTDALWLDHPDDTHAMLHRLEAEQGLNGGDIAAARDAIYAMSPRRTLEDCAC